MGHRRRSEADAAAEQYGHSQLAKEGISAATLHKWPQARGKGQLLPDADAGPEGWSSRDKFAAVLETAALNDGHGNIAASAGSGADHGAGE